PVQVIAHADDRLAVWQPGRAGDSREEKPRPPAPAERLPLEPAIQFQESCVVGIIGNREFIRDAVGGNADDMTRGFFKLNSLTGDVAGKELVLAAYDRHDRGEANVSILEVSESGGRRPVLSAF